MEVKPKTTEEFIIGAEKEMEFSIDTESHIIFDILRDKMYSDKIGAVAREVSSNSRDANRESGNLDRPVRIRMVKPNKFASIGHQSILFEDNGFGITPDRMADVFIKYASSTKRDSNDETGGFGLGAKTPFAYTDTFTVITVCDFAEPIQEMVEVEKLMTKDDYNALVEEGVILEIIEEEALTVRVKTMVTRVVGHEPIKRKEYTYNAIIDKSNKGKMILFDSEETTAETGTRIVVPIKTDSDRFEFERKVIKYTKHWGTGVEYLGFFNAIPTIEKIIDNDTFLIVKEADAERYGLLIDGIAYPLNTHEVGIKDKGVGIGYSLLLKFNTGDLTISANREAVQYDKDTVEQIKAKYIETKKKLVELAQEYVDKLPSYLEACKTNFYLKTATEGQRSVIEDDYLKVLAESFNPSKGWRNEVTILSGDSESIKIDFEGTEVVSNINLKCHSLAYIRVPRHYDRKVDYSAVTKVNITEKLASLPIYYADARKNKRRNETIWEDEGDFILIFPNDNAKNCLNEMNEVVTKFGLDFKLYSDVEMKKVERTYQTKTKQDGEVSVNAKEFDMNSSFDSVLLTVDRKTKKLVGKVASDYVYFVVPALSEKRAYQLGSVTTKMSFVKKHAKKTVVVVNEAAFRNWIQFTGMTKLDDEYNKVQAEFQKEWEAATLLQGFRDAFYEVVDERPYNFAKVSEELESILPKCMVGTDLFKEAPSKQKFVKQNIKFDFKGLVKKLRVIFDEEYPLLVPYLKDELGWYKDPNIVKLKRNINKYLNC